MAYRRLTLRAIQGSIRCLLRDTWASRRMPVLGSTIQARYGRAAWAHGQTVWDVLAAMPETFLYVGYHGYRYVLPRTVWDAFTAEERALFEGRCNRSKECLKAPLVSHALATAPTTPLTAALSMEDLLLKQRA